MNLSKIKETLHIMKETKIAVLGDYFLDKYLLIDDSKKEISLETGLVANQVVDKRLSPGAAGTVTNNLAALQVGKIMALGFIGNDGEGFELKKGLESNGIDIKYLIESDDRFTPTYMKPIVMKAEEQYESNRLDIKNRTLTPQDLQNKIIEYIREVSKQVDAFIVLDQVTEENCGVISDKVREELAALGQKQKDIKIVADSRGNIHKFKNVIIKCNHYEVVNAFYPDYEQEPDESLIRECGKKLEQQTNRPVFITWGKKGQIIVDKGKFTKVSAVTVTGEIDICGAGDATTSGITCGLCNNLSLADAALLGNIIASITIQQIGTTGTASPAQVIDRYTKLD